MKRTPHGEQCFSILLFLLLFGASAAASNSKTSGCKIPQSWQGKWFHLGFPEPLDVTDSGISGKGNCVSQKSKNMFLVRESDSFEPCYRCMMIYEKHYNVLQYKESYCEENIQSMEALCNTIAGDAPLYTMFRKGGDLTKCPFRGPFSFSYSKGGRGQVCEYPPSYLDTCSDNQKMKLKYQACLDVEGSEVESEEMSCLATWKEGSSRYLVALMNHSHVYTDESRYRCFVYQRQRQSHHGDSKEAVYKMAQSNQASCLGLWSVDEGYKTFTLKKLSKEGKRQCRFPSWLYSRHHDWHSVEEADSAAAASLHVNKRGHSIKLRNVGTHESHATCHQVENLRFEGADADPSSAATARVVAHVSSGCDSGYVCMVFRRRADHVIQMRYGGQSNHPSEACMNYHFDEDSSPVATFISGKDNTFSCPFSGRYSLMGSRLALTDLLHEGAGEDCHRASFFMQAGCSDSSDLHVESACHPRSQPARYYYPQSYEPQSDAPVSVSKSEFVCHGEWRGRNGRGRQLLLSSGPTLRSDNSLSRQFSCLSYSESAVDGVLQAHISRGSCAGGAATEANEVAFNITSSGPCLQALTGGAGRTAGGSAAVVVAVTVAALTTMTKALWATMPLS